jgi:hypothetical protein
MKTSARYFAVEEEVVDPPLSEGYEEGIKLLVRAMHDNQSSSDANWSAAKHNQSYFYVFRVESVNDLDPESGLIQERFRNLMQTSSSKLQKFASLTIPAVSSVRLLLAERLEGLSYTPASSIVRDPRFAFVDVHRVRGDMHDQYEALVTRLIGAMRKIGYPFAWSAFRTIIGDGRTFYGPPRNYHYVVLFDDWRQFFHQHSFSAALEEALGADGAQQYSGAQRKCLQGFENFTCAIRSDLSFQASQ